MKYEITKEQIESLRCVMNISSCENGISFLKEWFPEAFTQLSSDFTGWAKSTVIDNEKWLMYFEKGILKYGFDAKGDWFLPYSVSNIKKSDIEAAESEVFEALKNEAVKRYKNGKTVQCIKSKEHGWKDVVKTIKHDTFDYYSISGDFWVSDENELAVCVFINGKWAEIIETISKKEAEKLLNKKII